VASKKKLDRRTKPKERKKRKLTLDGRRNGLSSVGDPDGLATGGRRVRRTVGGHVGGVKSDSLKKGKGTRKSASSLSLRKRGPDKEGEQTYVFAVLVKDTARSESDRGIVVGEAGSSSRLDWRGQSEGRKSGDDGKSGEHFWGDGKGSESG
jgi:hypothetical protein